MKTTAAMKVYAGVMPRFGQVAELLVQLERVAATQILWFFDPQQAQVFSRCGADIRDLFQRMATVAVG